MFILRRRKINITSANLLLQQTPPQYVMACYTAGVAVECMMHAYRLRAGADDTAKHDLRLHAEIGGFYDEMSRPQREATAGLVGEIAARWRNNHRYRSADALRAFFLENRLHIVQGQTTTRDDVVVHNVGKLVGVATQLVQTGVERWTTSRAD